MWVTLLGDENLIYSEFDCKICGGDGTISVRNYHAGERDDVPELQMCDCFWEKEFLKLHAPEMNNLEDDENE
jgi:hypothetical protein